SIAQSEPAIRSQADGPVAFHDFPLARRPPRHSTAAWDRPDEAAGQQVTRRYAVALLALPPASGMTRRPRPGSPASRNRQESSASGRESGSAGTHPNEEQSPCIPAVAARPAAGSRSSRGGPPLASSPTPPGSNATTQRS